MEPTITYENLRIKNGFGLYKILDFQMRIEANTHATAEFTGIIPPDTAFTEIKKLLEMHQVSIVELEEDGEEKIPVIFKGLTKDVTIDEENGYYTVCGRIVSGTQLLDRKTKSRSFQDHKMTYQDIILEVLKDTPKAGVIFNMKENPEIIKPLIQYQETDWAFIRRLAGHLGEGLLPEVTLGEPNFWFGMRKVHERIQFTESERKTCKEVVEEKYYEMGGKAAGFRRSDYFHIQLDSTQKYKLGDKTILMDKELTICARWAKLIRGELIFTYHLAKPSYIQQKNEENEKITGMTLPGTVLATAGEVLKIHLDIDEKQDVKTAYMYRWVTGTGSLFYCMPKIGTRVELYFPDSDERNAYAIHCNRTNNAAECKELADYDKRYMTTEHQKRLYMFPEMMGLVGTSSNEMLLQFLQNDQIGLLFQSHRNVTILATKEIIMQARDISMQASKEIILIQGGNDDVDESI